MALDPKMLTRLIMSAKAHGEQSEPDHEASDLEELLWVAWGLMTPEQRTALVDSAEAKEILSWEFPKPL